MSIFEGFSISHAAILTGDAPISGDYDEETFGDFYGVNSGGVTPDSDNYQNTGDDKVLSIWYWMNGATVTVQGGYIPFRLISLITGESVSSSGSGTSAKYYLPLWTQKALNQVTRPMLIRAPSRDISGNPRYLDIVLFKVQFEPIAFDGPTYKDGLKINYNGTALMSTLDHEGNACEEAVGKLINLPVV